MSEQDPNGQPQPEQQPPAYGYPQQPGAQPPSQPGYPPQGYQQPGYPQPAYVPQNYGPPLAPKHPQAQTAMILGIIALAGGATCLLPILASPFAWYFGAKAKREIDAEPGRWSGRSDAQAGFILGLIGSVLLVLALLALILFVVLLVAFADSSSSGY